MLTGIELSGLILAVFPLLVSALEHYENGFQTIGDWIKFRAEFSAFMNSLALQRLLFRQNMEDLLSSLAVSDQALKGMLANPEDEGWKNPDLERRLRDRLSGQDEYEIYMSQVESVYNSVDKLRRKLKVEAGQVRLSTKSLLKQDTRSCCDSLTGPNLQAQALCGSNMNFAVLPTHWENAKGKN